MALLSGALVSQAAETRLAIVPQGERLGEAADVLTASLTGTPNLVLLERAEIEKVFREAALVPGTTNDWARLGRLMRADGLVLMQPLDAEHGNCLGLRLVALNSGVVLDASLYPLPLKDTAEWSKVVSRRLLPLLSKLGVPRDRAVPISFVNFRSSLSTPAGMETERQFSALLYHRLASEPELFVLERRQMGALQWEKDLAGAGDISFWNGCFLLEGVLDPVAQGGEQLTVSARLLPPGQTTPETIEVSGVRTNPAALADQLTGKILTALHRQPTVQAWDPQSEALRYADEAQWAFRWGLWPETRTAADSAWALGRQTEEVIAIKVRSWLAQAGTAETLDSDPNTHEVWAQNSPAPGIVSNARQALELYAAHSQPASIQSWTTNADWVDLGLDCLQTASLVLRHHYYYYWRQEEFEPELVELREAARRVAASLPAGARRSGSRSRYFTIGGSKELSTAFTPYGWFVPAYSREEALGRFGAFWQERPADTVRMYSDLLEHGGYAREREFILLRPEKELFWVAWSSAERKLGNAAWEGFIGELLTSSNALRRVEGALLKMRAAQAEEEVASAGEQFLHAALEPGQKRFKTEVDFGAVDAFGSLLGKKCATPQTVRAQQLLERWRALDFARLKHYFQTASQHELDRAGSSVEKRTFTSEEAQELLPVMEDYSRRFPRGDYIASILTKLRNTAQKTPEGAPPQPVVRSLPPPPSAVAASPDALRVARVWLPSSGQSADPQVQPRAFRNLLARDGRLFGLVSYIRFQRLGGDNLLALVEVNLEKGGLKFLVRDLPQASMEPLRFEVMGDALYWMEGKSPIHRLDLKTGATREYDITLPVDYNTHLDVAEGRLFIRSHQYIAALQPEDGTVKLLASARRRPAANELDAWGGWGMPRMVADSQGKIFAMFKGFGCLNPWSLDVTTGQWKQFASQQTGTDVEFNGGYYLFYSWDASVCEDRAATPEGKTITLLGNDPLVLPRWPMPYDYPLTPGAGNGSHALHAYDGTNLFILMNNRTLAAGPLGAQPELFKGRHTTLLWFAPQWEMPVEAPLWFEANPPGCPVELKGEPNGPFMSIPQGLCFLERGQDQMGDAKHFWFVSWKELRDWQSAHQPASHNLLRRESERSRKFDKNADGTLDPAELQGLFSDAEWRKAERDASARRVLLTFDWNRDERLSVDEVGALARAVELGVLTPRSSSMRNMSFSRPRQEPGALLRKYDRNGNQTLEAEEVAELLGREAMGMPIGPRFMPGRSNGVVAPPFGTSRSTPGALPPGMRGRPVAGTNAAPGRKAGTVN